MYEYLKNIDEGINSRYLTAMKNVRAASNSFYDSFLDLLEETIKAIADHFGYDYDEGLTCGQLIKKPEMKEILLNKIGVDEHTYGKFSDYSQKINRHKHRYEKTISIETVINYMKVFNTLISKYASSLGVCNYAPLDIDFLTEEFGKAERDNKRLKKETDALREELIAANEEKQLSQANATRLSEILKDKSKCNEDLEEENFALAKEISELKDIKLNSLETKLDKTLDMLGELQDYLVESRIATAHVSRLIDGKPLSDEELRAERMKMEASRHGK